MPSETKKTDIDFPVVGATVAVGRNCGVDSVNVTVFDPEAVKMIVHCWPGFEDGVGVETVQVEDVVEFPLICVYEFIDPLPPTEIGESGAIVIVDA